MKRRFVQVAVPKPGILPDEEHCQAMFSSSSLLSVAQTEELWLIISHPLELATNIVMKEVFEDWGD
jgi:hypothetical protein